MRTQLMPDSCGFEVAEMWCPLTDLKTYFIVITMSLILTGILCWIMWINKQCQKPKQEVIEEAKK